MTSTWQSFILVPCSPRWPLPSLQAGSPGRELITIPWPRRHQCDEDEGEHRSLALPGWLRRPATPGSGFPRWSAGRTRPARGTRRRWRWRARPHTASTLLACRGNKRRRRPACQRSGDRGPPSSGRTPPPTARRAAKPVPDGAGFLARREREDRDRHRRRRGVRLGHLPAPTLSPGLANRPRCPLNCLLSYPGVPALRLPTPTGGGGAGRPGCPGPAAESHAG